MLEFLKGRLIIVRILLLLAALVLISIGIATIYAVGNPADPSPGQTPEFASFWKKQIIFAAVAFFAMLAINLTNYRKIGHLSYWIYAAVLFLLFLLFLGKYVSLPFVPLINGTRRWIQLSIAGKNLPAIQPSEFCKLAYIIALAWYLRYRSNYRKFSALIGPFALTILPMAMILLEPDLGTVLLMMPILFTMLLVAGARIKHLMIITLLAILISPVMWHFMRPYQRTRISCVLLQNTWIRQKAADNPKFAKVLLGTEFSEKQWKNNWGYHLIRSKYAIASGGAKGYGFRNGPFIKYNFLPERYNDFIFASIAHQWGFRGAIALLAMYAIIVWAGLEIAQNNNDPFARLLAVGIVTMFAVEVIVNVGMTLGLMPITGLTLPLVSYGGSSLLVSLTAVGLLNNIGRSRAFTVAPIRN